MAKKIYIAPETVIGWSDAGGDYALDLGTTGGAADAVRVGARADLGSGSRSEWYEWRIKIDGFDTAPVVGETVDVYLATSDGTVEDGEVGVANADGVTAALKNLHYIGSATVQTTTAADNLQASGVCRIASRYVSPVIHNNTADKLLSSSDDHWFWLTPCPPELQ